MATATVAYTQQVSPYFGARMFHTIPGTAPGAMAPGGLPLTGGRRAHAISAATDLATDLRALAAHRPHMMRNVAFAGPVNGIPAATPGRSALYRPKVPISVPALQLGSRSIEPKNDRNDIGRHVSTGQYGQMSSAPRLSADMILHTKPVVPRFQL